MTRLTDYLEAEELDTTEPLSFYEPGAQDDPERALAARRGRRAVMNRWHPLPDDVGWGEE